LFFSTLHVTVLVAWVEGVWLSVSRTMYEPLVVYVVDTGDPVLDVPLPNTQLKVPTPVPVNVHVAPAHDPDVIVARGGTVTCPDVVRRPQPTLLQARTP